MINKCLVTPNSLTYVQAKCPKNPWSCDQLSRNRPGPCSTTSPVGRLDKAEVPWWSVTRIECYLTLLHLLDVAAYFVGTTNKTQYLMVFNME